MKALLLNSKSRQSQRGFSLVEVSVAIGITAVCLISMLGLLPIGSANSQNAIEQTTAASIGKTLVGDLRSTPTQTGSSLLFKFTAPLTSGSSTLYFADDGFTCTTTPSTSGNYTSRFRAILAWDTPTLGCEATTVHILITWPAMADPSRAAGSYEIHTTLDRN